MISIGKPYIKEVDDGTVRVCSVVNYDGKDNEIWYGVDKEYGHYLCHERADAFLLAFLPYAMAFRHNIKIDAAISEKLYYQLKNHYIPSLAKFTNYYHNIRIKYKKLDSTNYCSSQKGVGTGFSAGVDSFYTVLKHLDGDEKTYNLTHLTFFKVGATGSFGGKSANDSYNYRVNQFRLFAESVDLPFVTVDSNISEHARMSFNYIHTFRSMSAVLALQKLFHIYYYSSGTTLDCFSLNVVDAANYDLLSVENFSVEGMKIYSMGLAENRLDKQEYIKDFPVTYKYLNVCNSKAYNCSRCEKCLRTMAGFDCLGVLDNYKDTFDLDYYRQNKGKCLGYLMGKRLDGTPEGGADVALIKAMKKAGTDIPLSAYYYQIPICLKSLIFRTARNIKPIRKWYHKKMSSKSGCNYNDE